MLHSGTVTLHVRSQQKQMPPLLFFSYFFRPEICCRAVITNTGYYCKTHMKVIRTTMDPKNYLFLYPEDTKFGNDNCVPPKEFLVGWRRKPTAVDTDCCMYYQYITQQHRRFPYRSNEKPHPSGHKRPTSQTQTIHAQLPKITARSCYGGWTQ